MTREEAKQKVKVEKREVYPYSIDDNIDETIDDIYDDFEKELKQGQENYDKLWDMYSELKRENKVLQEYINETKDCMYCKEAKAIKVWDERKNK